MQIIKIYAKIREVINSNVGLEHLSKNISLTKSQECQLLIVTKYKVYDNIFSVDYCINYLFVL